LLLKLTILAMARYKLRRLLILLVIGPPILAAIAAVAVAANRWMRYPSHVNVPTETIPKPALCIRMDE
jgi:hypothetical protein